MMLVWVYWAAAIALMLGVAGLLLQAMRKGDSASDDASSLKVYRDQLSEVDRDLARAVITEGDAAKLRVEVSHRLLDADRALRAAPAPAAPASLTGPTLLIAMAMAMAFSGYLWLGAPNYPDLPLKERLAMAEENYRNRPSQLQAEAVTRPVVPAQVDAEFLALMQKLRDAVAERPDDQQGLDLLARNEAQLGNFIAARKALEQLVVLKGDQAGTTDHIALAQAMIVAAGGYVSPEAEAQLSQTLRLDATNPLARYYTGLMMAQVGRPDRTFAMWEPLLREGPEDAPWIAPIRAGLQDAADMAGIKYDLPPLADAHGPTSEDVAAAASMSGDARAAMIKGMVEQLNTRLNSEGGSAEDWAKLINALGVLGETDSAKAAFTKAETAFAGNDTALATISAAAVAAGIAP